MTLNLQLLMARLRYLRNRGGNKIVEQIESLARRLAEWADARDAEQDRLAEEMKAALSKMNERHTRADDRYARKIAKLKAKRSTACIKYAGKAADVQTGFETLIDDATTDTETARRVAENLKALTT